MASSLERLEQSHPVDVVWHAFELRPAGSPPMSPEYRARIEENRPRLNAIAQEQYGVALSQGPFGMDSRPALVLAKWAEKNGFGPAYHAAAMQAYWQDGRDISDPDVLEAIVGALGQDATQVAGALADPELVAEVDGDIQLAQELGLNSVPALVLEQKYLVVGAQPYDVLVEAVQKIREEEESSASSE